jgi:uncharacterized protein
MIALERIVGFEWDDANSRKSSDKHGVNQAESEQVFLNEPLLLVEDLRHSGAEARFHALGQSDGRRLLHITFTIRQEGTRIRVISARDMHRKERARYAQEA